MPGNYTYTKQFKMRKIISRAALFLTIITSCNKPIETNLTHGLKAGKDLLSIKISSSIHPQARKRSEEHTSELQSRPHLVCRLLLEKQKCLTVQKQLPLHIRREKSPAVVLPGSRASLPRARDLRRTADGIRPKCVPAAADRASARL